PHGLTRADLLCAATAATFKTPMYTLRPEAYIGAANGLKTLKYGKTRNPDAQDHWEIPPGMGLHGEIVDWDTLFKWSLRPPGQPNPETPNP
ncbi:MAG: hypothetical protein LBS27_02700, partial [Bifidobacteriaceae bacterium]|nr:hypothetical protein [Bifidobacteriaceae bacterium]